MYSSCLLHSLPRHLTEQTTLLLYLLLQGNPHVASFIFSRSDIDLLVRDSLPSSYLPLSSAQLTCLHDSAILALSTFLHHPLPPSPTPSITHSLHHPLPPSPTPSITPSLLVSGIPLAPPSSRLFSAELSSCVHVVDSSSHTLSRRLLQQVHPRSGEFSTRASLSMKWRV